MCDSWGRKRVLCVDISQASWIKSGGWSSKENRVPLPEEGVWVLGSKIIVLITDCQKDLNPFFPPDPGEQVPQAEEPSAK